MHVLRRGVQGVVLVALVVAGTKMLGTLRELPVQTAVASASRATPDAAPLAGGPPSAPTFPVPDSARGISGALRFMTLTSAQALGLPGFLSHYGEMAIHTPAVHQVQLPNGQPFSLIVLRPFGEKKGETLQGYRLGRWPAERWMMAKNYYNPDGFVEVTPANVNVALSEHFVLGDFLTHDQADVWPKYVVLQPRLIDKLELVLQDLGGHGYPASHAAVLSGFRAPYYNDRGVGEGMARASRHQYGDASDILIDGNGDGRMDDLNRDGRIDLTDVAPVSAAVARIEARFPTLVGGLGTYTAMGPSGPFAHIDVRGTSARWESGWWKNRSAADSAR